MSGNLINYKYGRKIGFVNLILSRFNQLIGRYRPYQEIRWEEVRRLVFICQGNICRSAYAEARAQYFGLKSTSAGIGAANGSKANSQAVKNALNRKVDLQNHLATHVTDFAVEEGDLFLCMEPSQADFMKNLLGTNAQLQFTILGLWSDDKRPFLQDPYGLQDEYWNTCFDIIDSALSQIRARALESGARVTIGDT